MLKTRDLLLRFGKKEDAEALYCSLWSRPEAFTHLFSSPSPDLAHAAARTAAYCKHHRQVKTEFFVLEQSTMEPIGIAGLKELAPDIWTVTDIAIGPDHWGKGYGKQILTLLRDMAFYRHHARELRYCCFADNAASIALAHGCGFRYSHSEPGTLPKNGAPVTLDCYHIIRQKITLVPATLRRLDDYFRHFRSDPAICSHPADYHEYRYSPESVEHYFPRISRPDQENFLILENGIAVGEVLLKHIDRDRRSCSLSIHLQNDSVKNRGIGTTAEHLAVQYAFRELDMNRIYADCVPANLRSQRVLEKVGFRCTGEHRGLRQYALARKDYLWK